jgi:hypothetical protein
MTCYAILRQLQDEGHRVSVVALRYPADPFVEPEREEELGVPVTAVAAGVEETGPPGTVPLRGAAGLGRIFPTYALRPRLREVLEELAPDAVFAYHWDTLAATHDLGVAPRFGAVDDPWHLPNLRRWQRTRPRGDRGYLHWTLSTLRGLRPVGHAMRELLDACEGACAFQSQTANDLGCEYLRAPIADAGGPDWQAHRREREGERFRILLGPSNLGATSTRAGLALVARDVLPALVRELAPGSFVVRLVGEGEPPAELAAHPAVEVTGRVEPADDEFRAAHVQLVPTPFALGKRVRIIVGWSFGTCVVAHAREADNLPELRHDENALLGGDGRQLAASIVRLANDGELRLRLAARGRETYERLFLPRVAGHEIVERIERLVPAGAPA